MNELALFAGAGGGILGGHLLGWRTVAAVEIEDYPRRVLLQRQADGILPRFPIWDDVQTFDGKPWRGKVDVISGGFPCQDISAAGKGAGIEGERSGLWGEMARIIREVRPSYVFVENSPVLTSRGLGVVLGDLAAMGYDARWGVLGAHHVAAPHKRERIWIVAKSRSERARRERREAGDEERGTSWQHVPALRQGDGSNGSNWTDPAGEGEGVVPNAECKRRGKVVKSVTRGTRGEGSASEALSSTRGWWVAEPGMGRMADGVANRSHRLRCLGNGQVPAVVRLAWEILTEGKFESDCPRPRKKDKEN